MHSNGNSHGVTDLRMTTLPSGFSRDARDQQEHQQPLFDGSNGITVVPSNSRSADPSSGIEPARKVKFLEKLMTFCGDLKFREQTCSTRNKTFVLCLLLSIVGLACSLGVLHMMWFTNTFNDLLLPRLALLENTQSAEWWARPPYHTYLRVHIFNYTNVEEYKSGQDDKLKLVDLGPYTYIERSEKIDVQYFPNKTMTYREKKSYVFDNKTSVGGQYDPVVVPNIPLASALQLMNENFFMKFSIGVALNAFQPQLFQKLPADSFLWGYEDSFFAFAQSFKPMPFDKFGVLVMKNRTSDDVFRIHTGEGDYEKIGQIESLNSDTKLPYWNTDTCNEITGTDGSQFPPSDIQKDKTVSVFVKDICRKFDLEYEEDVSVFGDLRAKRYRSPLDSFAYPENDTEKKCYCTDDDCPPSGVFDASVCTHGAPIYVSFPHFYAGDQVLIEKHEGIKPVKELHATFADLHPRMGYPMDFASRFQINLRLPKNDRRDLTCNVEGGDILPILWMEVAPATFPEEVQNAIYHSSFTANFVESVLAYGSIACTSGLLVFILYLLSAMFFVRQRR